MQTVIQNNKNNISFPKSCFSCCCDKKNGIECLTKKTYRLDFCPTTPFYCKKETISGVKGLMQGCYVFFAFFESKDICLIAGEWVVSLFQEDAPQQLVCKAKIFVQPSP